MKKALLLFVLFCAQAAQAKAEKLSIMLDWFINPDHAAIVVAKTEGFFDKYQLTVDIQEPADPALPPKLLAAEQVDLAVDYQPQLHMRAALGLPVSRVGTLIATPLNMLAVLADSPIKQLSDLKGKTIGYSVNGYEETLLGVMVKTAGLKREEVNWVNVNWALSSSLLSGKADAVYGGYRNFEAHQIAAEGKQIRMFYPEEHGIPSYDELVILAHHNLLKNKQKMQALSHFLQALEEATAFILNHPDKAWQGFVRYRKDLDTPLNQKAWADTLPRLALRPRALDVARYERMGQFLQSHGVIKENPPVSQYAVTVPLNP